MKIVFSLSVFLFIVASVAAEGTAYIQVAAAKVRIEPKLWATSIADLRYGGEVGVISEENGWAKVRVGAKEGYLPMTAISSRKVSLGTTVPSGKASKDDIVLAGKGFDKNTEEQFAKTGMPLNYAEVNRMERITVSESQLRAFVKNGKLSGS